MGLGVACSGGEHGQTELESPQAKSGSQESLTAHGPSDGVQAEETNSQAAEDTLPEDVQPEGGEHEELDASEDSAIFGCDQILCGDGFHCELKFTESCPAPPCFPEPTCIADEEAAAICTDDMCGPGAICELIESDCGLDTCPLEPVCTPKSCSESPPAQERCDISCSTGFVIVDDQVTCSCCAPAAEEDFVACLDDSVCPANEACDHQFCETPPACQEPGVICPAVCYGRCVAEGLLLQPSN
jgi:hypothetical protein